MWQRIQTLYIAISTALIAAMFFSLKAVVLDADGTFLQEYRYTSYIPYLVLLIVIGLFDLIALNAFKFRVFQMRTMVLSAIVTLALQIWIGVDYFTADSEIVFRYTAVFPAVAFILDVMAIRGIVSDILVADSVNRLRSSKKNRKR